MKQLLMESHYRQRCTMVGAKPKLPLLKNLSRKQLIKIGQIGVLAILILPIGLIPLRLRLTAQQAPKPEAILILGGDPIRDQRAAQLARHYPDLDVWVSSSDFPEKTQKIFKAAGIAENRVHQDFRATDTVTNFTTLVPEFKARQIHHLYLVTSSFHMPRAKAIATLVLGSQGITYTPLAVDSSHPSESPVKTVRDLFRSYLWLYTGSTGSSLGLTQDDF
jgi:uncharacterized SAM-binding protein YcdF (DUF218 family)